jgi:hypothetical protein
MAFQKQSTMTMGRISRLTDVGFAFKLEFDAQIHMILRMVMARLGDLCTIIPGPTIMRH